MCVLVLILPDSVRKSHLKYIKELSPDITIRVKLTALIVTATIVGKKGCEKLDLS